MKLVHVLLAASIAAFSSMAMAADNATPPTLDELLAKPPAAPDENSKISPQRLEGLKESAITYGMQAGLAFEYKKIMKRLDALASLMDRTYPFQALMMEGNVVPPVITEVDDVYDQDGSDKLRLADKERTILVPPRFSYSAPTWRDYFMHTFPFDSAAIVGVTPKTSEEEDIWKKTVKEGYEEGVAQADKIFANDTARLTRDLNGMRLYHQLLNAGKVTKPYVSVVHMGVTGNKKSVMKEGESLLQISATPEFVMSSKDWSVDLPQNIQDRLKVLVDPVAGAKLSEKLGVASEVDSLLDSKPAHQSRGKQGNN